MKSLKFEIASMVMVILLVILIFPISYVYGEKKAEDYYLEGKDYYINGNYDQAIESFTKAIKLNNNLADAYLSRGHAYAVKPNPDLNQAISDFDHAIKINPLEDSAFTGRGLAYARQGKLDLAIADFNQAIKLNPQNPLPEKWVSAAERKYIEEKLQQEQSTGSKRLPLSQSWKAIVHPFTLHVGLVYFLTIIGTFGLSLWGPTIMRESGASYLKAGFLLAIPNFCTIWAMIAAGRISDRLQKRKAVIAAVLFPASAAFLCMGLFGKISLALLIMFMSIAMAGIFARQGPLWAIPRQVLPAGALGLAVSTIGMVGNFRRVCRAVDDGIRPE